MVGIELPVLAMEHHYLLTEDIPELKGRSQEIVNTTDYAGEIYMRQEGGGALIGTYEPHGVVWSPVKTPDDFSMQLLPDELERLAPVFRGRLRAFPGARPRRHPQGDQRALHLRAGRQPAGRAGAWPAQLLGGLRRDGRASARAAASASCCRAGWPRAIRGRTSSRWTSRASGLSPRRSTRRSRCRRTTAAASASPIPTRNCRRPAPCVARRSTTGCSRRARSWAPISGSSTRCGLHRRASRPTETPTYRRSEAFPIVREECRAVRECVGLYETTNYGKYEMTGRGARAWLDRVFACRIPTPGRLGARADAEPGGPHRRRPVDRVPGRGPLSHRRLRLRRGIPPALVLELRAASRRVRAFGGIDAVRLLARRSEVARNPAAPDAQGPRRDRLPVLRRHRDGSRLRTVDRHARGLHGRTRLRDLDHTGLLRVALRRPARGGTIIGADAVSVAARCRRCDSKRTTARSTRTSGPTTRRAKPGWTAS